MNNYPVKLKIEWQMTDILFLDENTDWVSSRETILDRMKQNDLTDAIPYVQYRDFDIHISYRSFKTVDVSEEYKSFLLEICKQHNTNPPKISIENI